MKLQLIIIIIDSLRLDTFLSPELIGFRRIRKELTEIDNAWCGSFPTIPCRTDLFLGKLSFLTRRWGSLPNDSITLIDKLVKAGIRVALITDNHIIVDAQCGGNFQKGFSFWEFIRGHESDQWSWENPSKDLPELDCLTRIDIDYSGWTQYRRNYTRMSKSGLFPLPRMLKAIEKFLKVNKDNNFVLWIDCYSLHEPWCPGQQSVRKKLPARVLYPSYGSSARFNDSEIELIRECYYAQARLVSDWLNDLFNLVSIQLLVNQTSIIFMSDHGICLGDFGIIGKPKDCPIMPPLSRIPLYVKIPPAYLESIKLRGFIQPHHLHQLVLELFGLSKNKLSLELTIPIWGRNSPFSKHLQLLYDDKIIVLSRGGKRSFILPSDVYSSRTQWQQLECPNSKLLIEVHALLQKMEEKKWVNQFLN